MQTCTALRAALQAGEYDAALAALYALDGTRASRDRARDRALRMADAFANAFPANGNEAALFSGPGRTEIGGNHTDHQHGHVLCGSVDLDMLACAAPNGTKTVHILSEGYPALSVDLTSLEPTAGEENTSAALVRGVAARMHQLGYPVGGFDACVTSTVLSGSGLSSSAAYEVLVGCILNRFFCGGVLDSIELAKIGQYAENVFFGKPCGLMDQMGSSVGGAVAIDFADPAAPVVHPVAYDFTKSGHALCIVDTGSCHADLTDDYAAIRREMESVAEQFGKKVLREVDEDEFYKALPKLRKAVGDRAVVRAMHFYNDCRRAAQLCDAVRDDDFDTFLKLIIEGGHSSFEYNQNAYSLSN